MRARAVLRKEIRIRRWYMKGANQLAVEIVFKALLAFRRRRTCTPERAERIAAIGCLYPLQAVPVLYLVIMVSV